VFFQGLANESFWIDPAATAPFQNWKESGDPSPYQNQAQLLQVYADSHWSEDNQNLYALWPRLSSTPVENNNQRSTWFMRDGTFLRLKQAEIGYSIGGKWKERVHLNNFRVYLSGTNLLMFSKFNLWDAEMGGNGLGYPLQKVFNIGVNMSFN